MGLLFKNKKERKGKDMYQLTWNMTITQTNLIILDTCLE